MSLTHNIREVLEINELSEVLRELFQKEVGATITSLSWKVSNVHESITIRCTPRQILGDMLVKIRDQIGISYICSTVILGGPFSLLVRSEQD